MNKGINNESATSKKLFVINRFLLFLIKKKVKANCHEIKVFEFLLKFGSVSKIMTNGEKIRSKALFVIVLLKF